MFFSDSFPLKCLLLFICERSFIHACDVNNMIARRANGLLSVALKRLHPFITWFRFPLLILHTLLANFAEGDRCSRNISKTQLFQIVMVPGVSSETLLAHRIPVVIRRCCGKDNLVNFVPRGRTRTLVFYDYEFRE